MTAERALLSYEDARTVFHEVAPAFINAFAGEPWNEVSKCVDRQVPQRCLDGLSSVAIGSMCETCEARPTQPAYTIEEITADFEAKGMMAPTVWYVERVMADVALAGYASRKGTDLLLESPYSNTLGAEEWLDKTIGREDVTWLHELFADVSVRASGNLHNFKHMCTEMMDFLDTSTLAFCTINPRMVAAARRNFEKVQIFQGNVDSPDHRDFVLIKK